MNEKKVSILGEIIYTDIDLNPYLNELYENILYNYSIKLFQIKGSKREVGVEDALRFADILSKSNNLLASDRHKIWAQEIVALLKEIEPDHPAVELYLSSVLSCTGNYQGLSMMEKKMARPENQHSTVLDALYLEYNKDYMQIPAAPELQFFRSQKAVYDHLNDSYFSYSGPTSMGKSFIMRMFIKDQVQSGTTLNYAIVVPTKALLNEVSSRMIRDLNTLLKERNYKVVTSPGALVLKEDHNFIFVLTPERLLYLLIGDQKLTIDYLFIDEAHKISSRDSRSTFYYKVIDMVVNRGNNPQVVFSSPNIPNPEEYLKLVPGAFADKEKMLATAFSPVSQMKYLVDFEQKNVQAYNTYKKSFISIANIDPSTTFAQIIAYIGSGSQNIVYCSSITKAVEQAVEYAKNKNEKNIKELSVLARDIANEVHGDYYLCKIITKGIAYHIGYLPSAIRMRIEQAFRDGLIHTIFCTSTLLEGVNLPADNLFVTSYKCGASNMNVVDFRNLIGRVGRIEFNLYGNVYLVRLPEEKKVKTETYVELLKADVPRQALSVVSGLSDEQKNVIISSLAKGDLELNSQIKVKEEDYAMMRKFALILLKDITNGNDSIVKRTFEPLLSSEIEAHIKSLFSKPENKPDDDINISVDQNKALVREIARGRRYPNISADGFVDYNELTDFLECMCRVFKWERYEKETLGFVGKNGLHGKLRWYAVILSQWVKGEGLRFIMNEALKKKLDPRYKTIYINFKPLEFDNSVNHRNIVISQTLEAIERVILFSISNYFLKFSQAYKKYFQIEGDMKNDWYEYVEYGTTNPLSIMLQRHGFSRETATYIRNNRNLYVAIIDDEVKLKNSIISCGNISVANEVKDVRLNMPELFVG